MHTGLVWLDNHFLFLRLTVAAAACFYVTAL